MLILPEEMPIPAALANTIRVAIGDGVTARDLSYSFAAAWLIANGKSIPLPDHPGHYKLPDNPLRGALGRSHRDSIDIESGRFERLERSIVSTHAGSFPMPTLMSRGGYPVRSSMDGMLTWKVSDRLIELFQRDIDGLDVRVPRKLLVEARNRATIEFYMHALAWHCLADFVPGFVARTATSVTMRLTPDEAIARLGLEPGTPPSRIMQTYLQPIIDDLGRMGCHVEVEMRRVGTIRNPKGRVRDFTILVNLLEPSRIERESLKKAYEGRSEKAWAPKVRQRQNRRGRNLPPVATVENVVVFKPSAAPIKPPERVSPWSDKIDSNGQQIRQDINDSDEIEF